MKVLNIVESAFRTLVEEQDDTILWLTQSLARAGADISILLKGNASIYPFVTEPIPALELGDWKQTSPANLSHDLYRIFQDRIQLYVIEDEVVTRGYDVEDLPAGVTPLIRNQLPGLYDSADVIWHW